MLSSRLFRVAPAALLLGAAGCEFPTEAPKFENVFVVRAADLALSAGDLLPDSVTVRPDSSAFDIQTDTVSFSAKLGQMCPSCGPAHGTTVPKPAFTYSFGDAIALPGDIAGVEIASGLIPVRVTNNLGFDPIRPSASARGVVTITLRNGTTVVGQHVMNGNFADLPQGIVRTINISVGAFTWDQDLSATIDVDSPAGDPVTIDTSRSLQVRAGPMQLSIASVTVNVASRSFADTSEADLTELSGEFGEKVQGGAVRLTFENPFNIGGSFSLELRTPTTTITKSLTLSPNATSTNRLSLTAGEIQSLLGEIVTVTISGGFSAPGGTLTLTPRQVARIITEMELTLIPFGD